MESMQDVLSFDAVRILHGRVYIQNFVYCKPVFLDNNFSYWSLIYIIERAEKSRTFSVLSLPAETMQRLLKPILAALPFLWAITLYTGTEVYLWNLIT